MFELITLEGYNLVILVAQQWVWSRTLILLLPLKVSGVEAMNDFVFYVGFVFFSMLFYLPSFWARFAYSGGGISLLGLLSIAVYNIFFIGVHILHAKTGYLPIIDKNTNYGAQWFSFFVAMAYVFSLPGAKKKYMWFTRR